MPINKSEKRKRVFKGVVISDKMDKTLVVLVNNTEFNSKYKKHYISSKKYKVHDEKNKYKKDDEINFMECRPISKDKKWRVI
ncbi:MAG: 30S ribosomal protein S17 [bacterium]